MTLASAQHDSFKLGKLSILRHKASEVPLYNMNPKVGCKQPGQHGWL